MASVEDANRNRKIEDANLSRKRESIRFYFEIIGGIVAIAALIVGFRSLNATVGATNKALEEAKYESVYEHQLNLWGLAADKPEVAPYILGGKKPNDQVTAEDKDDAVQAAALANALDFYAYVFAQLAPRDSSGDPPDGVLTADDKPGWVEQGEWDSWVTWASTIVNGFRGAPGMCGSLDEKDVHGNYAYDGAFRTAVSEAVPNCVSS
jgi:hypothetical protein